MIDLFKGPIPRWLAENQEAATASYVAAPAGSKPAPWRATEVVSALRTESHDKCMYCEGVIDDVSYSAVEHVHPKSLFPELVLDWDNLGLVCTRCNTNKGDYSSDRTDLALLNPYADLVADHLEFIGAVVAAADGSSRGENTIRQLRLMKRPDLWVAKMRRIEEIEVRIRLWQKELDPDTKQLLAEDLRDALSREREYSATLVAYASRRGFSS